MRNLQAENKTILLTTHYMFEADALCQRIAVIDHGMIVALDTPEGLKRLVAICRSSRSRCSAAPKLRSSDCARCRGLTPSRRDRDQRQLLQVQIAARGGSRARYPGLP